jgi:hypothetical protein
MVWASRSLKPREPRRARSHAIAWRHARSVPIEKDLLDEPVQRRLVVGMETWKAARVGVEAGHLRQGIPQPIAHLSAFSTGPVNATKFQPPKSGVLVWAAFTYFLAPRGPGPLQKRTLGHPVSVGTVCGLWGCAARQAHREYDPLRHRHVPPIMRASLTKKRLRRKGPRRWR